ncbi:MAG: CHC2 zinc finger domain-containing protein [Nitrospirota bacterium]
MPKLDSDLLTQARQVDLIAYLQAHGHEPVHVRADRATFHSPLREDRNPSFSIRYKEQAWKWVDYGTGEHGDGIDLVMHLHHLDFQTAVKTLLQLPVPAGSTTRITTTQYVMTPRDVRRIYFKWKTAMTAERTFLIHQYFLDRQLAFPEGLGIIYLERMVNKDGLTLPYIGIPSPSAQPHLITSLECRALHPDTIEKQYRRRTLGDKALWVIRRPSSSILITESILDCLAGNQLLQNRTSLCALNSTNNVELLVPCMKQLRPATVYLALDHDTRHKTPRPPARGKRNDGDPGPRAQGHAREELLHAGFRVVEVQHHVQAGVKDLHKLLLQDASPITLDALEHTGQIYLPS